MCIEIIGSRDDEPVLRRLDVGILEADLIRLSLQSYILSISEYCGKRSPEVLLANEGRSLSIYHYIPL